MTFFPSLGTYRIISIYRIKWKCKTVSKNLFWAKAGSNSCKSDKSVEEQEDSSPHVDRFPIAGEYYTQKCSATFKRTCSVELVSVEILKRAHPINYPVMLPI